MGNPTGTIQSLVVDAQGTRAIIEVDTGATCQRCAAGRGCGAGLFGGNNRVRQLEAVVAPDLTLVEGDNVEISLVSSKLLRAALIVYGLPLLGAVVAVGLAFYLALGDPGSALAAIAGLGLGLIVSRSWLRQDRCIRDFVPRVEKRLQSAQIGA